MDNLESKKTVEPLSHPPHRYSLFPIRYPRLWELYKKQVAKFWTREEIDFSQDKSSWDTLNSDEQHYLAVTLAFFANSDNVVIENLGTRFLQELNVPEAQAFLAVQAFIENIHVEVYMTSIDTVITNQAEKIALFRAIEHNPIVQPKLQWAQKWIGSEASLAQRIIAFIIVEGVFFSSSFASIFYFRKQGKVPGIIFSNEKIVEDEALHVLFGVAIHHLLAQPLAVATIHAMFREGVALEHQFVEQALPVALIGMNADLMKQYVCRVADTVLGLLKVPPLYNVANPFNWMEGIGLQGKGNFFEKRIAEYERQMEETKIHQPIQNLGQTLDF